MVAMEIKEIHLLTNDIITTETFYSDILELKLDSRDHGAISFSAGSTKLVFRHAEGESPFYHVAFEIPGSDLEESYQWIKNKLPIIPITEHSDIADFRGWNAKSFYFYDNNASILEFICRYDVHHSGFSTNQSSVIRYISEIGIVCENVPAYADKLIDQFKLEIFRRQPRQDKFTVIGDDLGLFILVEKARDWYPTSKQAKLFWSKIVFSVNGVGYELVPDH